MNCSICKKPIKLPPGAPNGVFTTHADCDLAQRAIPLPRTPVAELPVIFQNLEMLRLRQQVAKTFGIEAGTKRSADYVNGLTEGELLAML